MNFFQNLCLLSSLHPIRSDIGYSLIILSVFALVVGFATILSLPPPLVELDPLAPTFKKIFFAIIQ